MFLFCFLCHSFFSLIHSSFFFFFWRLNADVSWLLRLAVPIMLHHWISVQGCFCLFLFLFLFSHCDCLFGVWTGLSSFLFRISLRWSCCCCDPTGGSSVIDMVVGGAQRAELHCQRDATSPLIVRIRVAQVAIVMIWKRRTLHPPCRTVVSMTVARQENCRALKQVKYIFLASRKASRKATKKEFATMNSIGKGLHCTFLILGMKMRSHTIIFRWNV